MRNAMPVAFAFVVGMLSLSGCHAPTPRERLKTVVECMLARHSNDDFDLVTHCEPLGKVQIFRGIIAFEMEGTLLHHDEGDPSHSRNYKAPADVILRDADRRSLGHKVGSKVGVVLLGRKKLLPSWHGDDAIVVDRIIRKSLLPVAGD